MTNTQIYLDAFYFVIGHTDILVGFGAIFAISIAVGALFLDRFVLWLWVIIFILFLSLTQYQINQAMEILKYTPYQMAQPLVIRVISAVLFVTGSGLGYLLKVKRQEHVKRPESPDIVAKDIVAKVNGGTIETSPNNRNVFLD